MRICFGGCLTNFGGETVECEVHRVEGSNPVYPTYTVKDKQGKRLYAFTPYHMSPLGNSLIMFQIDISGEFSRHTTLIVPEHGMLEHIHNPDDEEEE